jgi:hypothetical protein
MVSRCHDTMAKNLTVRLDDQLAADTEAVARAEGKSLNETVKQALIEAVECRRQDPEFRKRPRAHHRAGSRATRTTREVTIRPVDLVDHVAIAAEVTGMVSRGRRSVGVERRAE